MPSTLRAAGTAVVGTAQLLALLALAVGPLAAGVLLGVGPPTYTATVEDVVPGTADDATDYDALDADSRAVVEALLAADGDRIERRTAEPPGVLEPGERVIQRDGYAVRVGVERSTPLRLPAVLAGLVGSTLTTLLGAAIAERRVV